MTSQTSSEKKKSQTNKAYLLFGSILTCIFTINLDSWLHFWSQGWLLYTVTFIYSILISGFGFRSSISVVCMHVSLALFMHVRTCFCICIQEYMHVYVYLWECVCTQWARGLWVWTWTSRLQFCLHRTCLRKLRQLFMFAQTCEPILIHRQLHSSTAQTLCLSALLYTESMESEGTTHQEDKPCATVQPGQTNYLCFLCIHNISHAFIICRQTFQTTMNISTKVVMNHWEN